jgi:four helix bundle protein
MGYQTFKELKVWQEARNLAIEIYKITEKGKFSSDFGLKSHIQRSALSIASNIAEGYERNSDKEFVRFLLISKGSISELRTQLEIAFEVGYLNKKCFEELDDKCQKIGAMITRLIQHRKSRHPINR